MVFSDENSSKQSLDFYISFTAEFHYFIFIYKWLKLAKKPAQTTLIIYVTKMIEMANIAHLCFDFAFSKSWFIFPNDEKEVCPLKTEHPYDLHPPCVHKHALLSWQDKGINQ